MDAASYFYALQEKVDTPKGQGWNIMKYRGKISPFNFFMSIWAYAFDTSHDKL